MEKKDYILGAAYGFSHSKSCALSHVCLFLSFGMAYDFIDSIGNDVDVVSDSEVSFTVMLT